MSHNEKKTHQFINVSKKSCLLILLCALIVLGLNLIAASKKQPAPQELNGDRLIIFKNDGQGILMDYTKPELIKAPFLPELPINKIRYEANYQFSKYAKILNEGDYYNIKLYNDGWIDSKKYIFQVEFSTLNLTYSMN